MKTFHSIIRISICMAVALCALLPMQAQTLTTPPAATVVCPAGSTPPYSYFGSAGVAYNYYGQAPSVSTGFGVKTGACSNAFLVTTISTGVGSTAVNQGYAVLSESFEYHLARSGYFEFNGDGQIGAVQTTSATGAVTSAMFAGGISLGYDLGGALTKGKIHIPVVAHFDYVAITSTEVKPTYWLDFRKTF